MLPFMSAVMPQIVYAHSVREFIRALLKRFIPGRWIERVIPDSDSKFDAKLDAAFSKLDEATASDRDYCAEVVSVLCDEVSRVCEVLRLVCVNRGYGDYAETYLSTEKFIRLLLRRDTAKLQRLNAVMQDSSKPLCVLLRDIGAALDDRPPFGGDDFGAAEVQKANAELMAIAADVKDTIRTGLDEVRNDIAEVRAGMSRIKSRGRRRGKYADVGSLCLGMWEAAQTDASLRNSLNTRVTYAAVFARRKAELEWRGIDSAEKFRKVIHAAQSKRSSDNIKRLHAQQDQTRRRALEAATGTHNTARKIFDIIRAMRTNAKNAVALSLAIAGAMASPLRSDAVSRKGSTPPPPHCCIASCAQPKGLSSLFYMTAQPCAISIVSHCDGACPRVLSSVL